MITTRAPGAGVRVASLPLGGVLDLETAARLGGLATLDDRWRGADAPGLLPGRAWLDAVAPLVDVAHVHVGAAVLDPGALALTLAELERERVPVLVTVHALGPRAAGAAATAARDEVLDLALAAAVEVVAPSVELARALLDRWARWAHVLPIPTALPAAAPGGRPARAARSAFDVGLDLTRRPPGDDAATISFVARALRNIPGARLHASVRPGSAAAPTDGGRLGADVQVLARDPLPASAVAAELGGLDAVVVPADEPAFVPWVQASLESATFAITAAPAADAAHARHLTYDPVRPETLVHALGIARRSVAWSASLGPEDPGYLVLGYRELLTALASERCGQGGEGQRPGSGSRADADPGAAGPVPDHGPPSAGVLA